ncbi:hypothetical protein Leryth_002251 [Lithospermum erythrorhizon]|nr:hypothetical protein Leryth_002251 [Lithospermum erythrorhizon]
MQKNTIQYKREALTEQIVTRTITAFIELSYAPMLAYMILLVIQSHCYPHTLFVAHLNHLTSEDTLRQAMNKFGRVVNLRLVRHIVTGASRGYAFVEFETDKEMRRAYKDAHHAMIDDSEIIVDYNRQQLMPGWIPRRLGGGLGGKKESGQLRFGGRERPFRAPLRPIPLDELKRLGIQPPPEGNYMSRFEVPSPPRRKKIHDKEHYYEKYEKRGTHSRRRKRSASQCRYSSDEDVKSTDREKRPHKREKHERHSKRHKTGSSSRDPSYGD